MQDVGVRERLTGEVVENVQPSQWWHNDLHRVPFGTGR